MRFTLKRSLLGAALTLAATVPFASGASAVEPSPQAGPVTISPESGTQATNFLLHPTGGNASNPEAAYCPGDSANDGYRWQTFFTPIDVDPMSLTHLSTEQPTVPAAQAAAQPYTWNLYSPGGSPIQNLNTSVNPRGFIDPSATFFSWNVFPTDLLVTGDYWVGISCTKAGITESYWAVPVTITATGTGYDIALIEDEEPPADIPEAPLSLLLPISGALVAGAAVLVLRRRQATAV